MLRLKQISDDNGFAKRKSGLNDAFQKADIFFECELWSDAASSFDECSRQVEFLEKLDSERKTADEKRKNVVEAQDSAKNAQAEKYATAEWENAIKLLSDGMTAYGRMDFATAIVALSDSAAGFLKSEQKAIDERKEAERKAREEAERRSARDWRKYVVEAMNNAREVGAERYATVEWENAVKLLSDGDAAYERMDFTTAKDAFCASAARFSKSKQKAIEERKEEDRKAREEAERKAREEAVRKAREEAERKAREEAERKAREEAERKAREEAERKVREEAARKAREEAERKAREKAERKAREKAERKADGKISRKMVIGLVASLGLAVGVGWWFFNGRVARSNGRTGIQLWKDGPYWADRNIGADSPEDYGCYFWWGDTVGYKRVNDAWVASDGSSLNFSFSEANILTYRRDSSQLRAEGWITAEGVLAQEYDAAHVQWGGRWRMPTKKELDDLTSKCDWKWTTLNGVNGYKVRGKGTYRFASIFLPSAGSGYGTSLYTAGSYGYYWSSVPSSDYYNAWYLRFGSSGHRTYYDGRLYGQSVRPVQGFTK